MIGIRADGNNQIGMGHVMRCLTIAEALKQQKEDVLMIFADDSCEKMAQMRGFETYILETDFRNMEEEVPKLLALAQERKISKLIVDSYWVTENYLQKIRQKVITVYLDDINQFVYPVDLLINYNVFAEESDYPYAKTINLVRGKEEKWEGTLLLSGACYAPVREAFLRNQKTEWHSAKTIMLSLGGSDAYNLSYKIARELLKNPNYLLHVVCGPFNKYRYMLEELAQKEERVCLHCNVTEMWRIMKNCDLAVSAAGSTMCELAVMGVPAVTFSFAENQRKIAKAFEEKQAAYSVGHYVEERETEFMNILCAKVDALMTDEEKRRKLSEKAREIVDGRGAMRIAEAIQSL